MKNYQMKLFWILVVLAFMLTLAATILGLNTVSKTSALLQNPNRYTLVQSKTNNKWGYMDTSGSWIIEPKFDKVSIFIKNLSVVAVDCIYPPANKDGVVILSSGMDIRCKYGVIDTKGSWVLKPKYNEETHLYKMGKDHLVRLVVNEKYGIMDIDNGMWILTPKYDYIWGNFNQNGLTVVEIDGKYGVIDTKGSWTVKPIPMKEIPGHVEDIFNTAH